MIVPKTALIATTIADAPRVSFSAASACGAVTSSQNEREPVLERLRDHRRERDQDDQAQVRDDEAAGEPGAGEAEPEARPRRCLRSCDGPLTHSVATPRFVSISAIEPFSGSKNSVVTSSQPPRSAIVNRSGGVGNLSSFCLQHRLDHRPVAAVGPQLLRLVGVEVVDERLRRVVRLGRDRDRRLDQDRAVGDDVLDVLAGVLRGDRLVLVGEQDVALAAEERPQRVTGALVLDRRRSRAGSGRTPGPPPRTRPRSATLLP